MHPPTAWLPAAVTVPPACKHNDEGPVSIAWNPKYAVRVAVRGGALWTSAIGVQPLWMTGHPRQQGSQVILAGLTCFAVLSAPRSRPDSLWTPARHECSTSGRFGDVAPNGFVAHNHGARVLDTSAQIVYPNDAESDTMLLDDDSSVLWVLAINRNV